MTQTALTHWLTTRFTGETPADRPPPRTLGAFLRWALEGCWIPITIAALGFGIGGLFEALIMYLLGQIVDATAAQSGAFWSENMGLLVVALLTLLVLRPLFFWVATAFQTIVLMPGLFFQVMARLNRHTLGQSVTFFDDDFAGRIAQKQMQTANSIVSAAQETVNAVTFAVSAVLGMMVLGGFVDPGMMVILTLWMVAYGLVMWHFMPRIRTKSTLRAEARAAVTGQVVDTITNIKTVKLFAHHAHEDRAALSSIANYRTKATDWAILSVNFRLVLITLAGALPVLMVGYGLIRWNAGAVTAGDLAAVGAMSIRLAQMTGWVSWTLMGIYADLGEVEDGIRTLSPPHSLVDAPEAAELTVTSAEITFENTGFSYGRQIGGVQDLSLTIHPGEKLALVGASGAGKSTLVSLLLRLYDTETGRILIDGQDVSAVTQESLRRRIGMVTQETAMFNRSAFDNIRYGRPEASKAEVIAAAQKAEAHHFISDLEDFKGRKGYDAFLGERGVKLSGGQRQRIALARAILKDAPILVMDEATSALDSEVEAQIQAALERVMEGKTVLAIAHRLSTIATMDRIVVLDQGRIAEIGTHEALLTQGGLYAGYWTRQSGGFLNLRDVAE